MAFYLVVADEVKVEEALGNALNKVFSGGFYKISNSTWLLSDKGATSEIVDRLGLGEKDLSGFVCRVGSYGGWTDEELWDWIADKSQKSGKDT